MRAQAHPLQAQRLAALRRYDILDTPRESDFDEIVELAAAICETPISVVNLIDDERQWFKAETGLGARETPLETSICSHVILEADFVEIPDTHEDPRTCDNELCTPEDGLRFYAGALLKTSNGMPIGTLCVLDNKPRTLTPYQKRSLEILARRVMRELDLRLSLKTQATLRDEMDHRVKNSLQTIASYVRVYQGQLQKNEEPSAVLDAVARRVEAVSALHEALHNTADTQHVQLGDFLERITGYLAESAPPRITVSCRTQPLEVEARLAGNIGVIVSEFVANAIKHGFPEGEAGHVTLAMSVTDNALSISCTDDGVGSDAAGSGKGEAKVSLGTRLLKAAASQIGAQINRIPLDKGYKVELAVPVDEHVVG
ncbi:histidine kinase dimerization/phosphoacceptor domain -containing protein [Henriciella sp.]|uniref:histidine kinase dimerization/phosphoacceptor domain -containing protein n=1 Tax=Henriciella sp. TaxID=1968823 RepID=UPI0026296787|nr:histidine kinase dimerization/phosphoacceptor domain -containing protein [Henriciella sp.]